MKDRSLVQMRLQKVLTRLIQHKKRPEEIAVDLGMSVNAIYGYASGRRFPVTPVIQRIEQLYQVKIL